MYGYNYGYGYGHLSVAVSNLLIKYSNWQELPVQDGYVTDGVELNDGSWSTSTGWTDNGDGSFTNDGSARTPISKTILPSSGYSVLEFTTTDNVQVYTFNPSFGPRGTFLAGTHKVVLENGDDRLYFYPRTLGDMPTISNISVQKVIQEPNKRYIRDEGINPKYPLALNSGQGKYFNGTNSDIPIDTVLLAGDFEILFSIIDVSGTNKAVLSSGDAASFIRINNTSSLGYRIQNIESSFNSLDLTGTKVCSIKREGNNISLYLNGTFIEEKPVTINTMTINTIASLGISSQYFDGILKDLYIFNRALTEAERTKQYQYPEDFFIDVKTGVITDCVLNMPMNDKDDNARDYSSYSETNLYTSDFSTTDGWTEARNASTLSVTSDVLRCTADGSLTFGASKEVTGLTVGQYYKLKKSVLVGTSLSVIVRIGTNSSLDAGTSLNEVISTDTDYNYIFKATNSIMYFGVVCTDDNTYFEVKDVSFDELSGIHPIVNPTNDTNDLAKQLPVGTQDCLFVENSQGVIESKSPFLEGNGLSYGDTGRIPPSDSDWSIEIIQDFDSDGFQLSGTGGSSGRVYIGCDGNSDATCKVGSTTEYISSSEGLQYLVLTYNSTDSSFQLYLNGVSGGVNNTTFSTGVEYFTLLCESSQFYIKKQISLFSIHNKELTQEEVTEAYNKVVNKGLLS